MAAFYQGAHRSWLGPYFAEGTKCCAVLGDKYLILGTAYAFKIYIFYNIICRKQLCLRLQFYLLNSLKHVRDRGRKVLTDREFVSSDRASKWKT